MLHLLLLFSLVTSLELHFPDTYPVWSARWIHKIREDVCDLWDVFETSHRLASLSQKLIIEIVPHEHEIDPMNDGHIHDHLVHPDEDQSITTYGTKEQIEDALRTRCRIIKYLNGTKEGDKSAVDIVRQLINTGNSSNRIDVVFMGDGYLANQLDQMENDMLRLTNDMFNGVTFSAYLPVFNIWSVFRPSNQEGIGVGGVPKDTAFGLYRDGTELRAVYCSKQSAARDACRATGPNACDFPSLIGNDPYYGGLGGTFVISTQSPTSGTIVLRHEMGHSFINTGDEYDGGTTSYYGVNFSPAANGNNVSWKQWATEPDRIQLEGAAIRVQDYAWYNLANGQYVIRFNSSANYTRWMMTYSVSGCETQDALSITLDGKPIPWYTHNSFDRFFDDFSSSTPLGAGNHTLIFQQITPAAPGNPIRQLCSVVLIEYLPEPYFHMDNHDYVGAYPTWRQGSTLVGYRPTNEACLMRHVTTNVFCPICYEGLWLRFFARISAIDSVVVQCVPGDNPQITLNAVKLGQLREGGPNPGEWLQVRWFWNGTLMPTYNDQFHFPIDRSYVGNWRVTVQYITPQVRSDPNNLLRFQRDFQVPICN